MECLTLPYNSTMGHVVYKFTNIACIFSGTLKGFFFCLKFSGWLFARACGLWFSVRMSKLYISSSHPVHERGIFPPQPPLPTEKKKKPKKRRERWNSKKDTWCGALDRKHPAPPFHPAHFNEKKLRLDDALRPLVFLDSASAFQTKSLTVLTEAKWSHSPDNSTLTRATAKQELLV